MRIAGSGKLDEVIYTALKAYDTGSFGKIYPIKRKQGDDYTCIIYSNISETFENHLTGILKNVAHGRYHIDIYDTTFDSITSRANDVIGCLLDVDAVAGVNVKIVINNIIDISQEKNYRKTIDLSIWISN